MIRFCMKMHKLKCKNDEIFMKMHVFICKNDKILYEDA